MPFGLVNSGSTYQRLLDETLRPIEHADPYIDDVCVHSNGFDHHLSDLEGTLKAFRKARIQLRRDKCTFGYLQGEFLGHVVSREGHTQSPRLVDKIRNAATPRSKKDLLRFLGLANLYREYVPNFAAIAGPLYQLTQDKSHWAWKDNAASAFDSLKSKLTASPVILAFPDWESEFVLQVDASSTAVGGILSQREGEYILKPLAFFSSGLTPAQKNYSAGELECWAVIAASRKFRKYLQAAPSLCFLTDHNPLVWLRRQKDPRGKFSRWIQVLESLEYRIEHVKGVENAPADYLSRVEAEIDWEVNNEKYFERHVYATREEVTGIRGRLILGQKHNPATSSAINQLKSSGGITEGQFKNQLGVNLTEGLLCRGRKVIVPSEMKNEILTLVHNEGHLGIDKTTRLVRQQFY